MKHKGIIFDMDGTLWDSAENVAKSWNKAIADYGYERAPITKEDMYSVHGGELYPDVEKTLDELSERYDLYIVSNCQRGYIESFFAYHGLGRYFKDTECYGNNELEKSENIKLIVERNNIDEAVYVGDIQGDYDSSKKAGVKFIHAAYGFGTIDDDVPAIRKFSELPRVADRVFEEIEKH